MGFGRRLMIEVSSRANLPSFDRDERSVNRVYGRLHCIGFWGLEDIIAHNNVHIKKALTGTGIIENRNTKIVIRNYIRIIHFS